MGGVADGGKIKASASLLKKRSKKLLLLVQLIPPVP
jgi:hypothetical protein